MFPAFPHVLLQTRLLKPLQCLWLLPYSSHSKAAQLLFLVPLAIPSVPREAMLGWSTGESRARAAPTLHICNVLQLPLHRASKGGREEEQQENNSGYLPRTPKLERGRELTAQNRNMYFGWARNKCLLPPSTTTARGSSAGISAPQGLHPCARLPAKVGGVCPRYCFPGNPLPLWPHHTMQTQIWLLWIKPHRDGTQGFQHCRAGCSFQHRKQDLNNSHQHHRSVSPHPCLIHPVNSVTFLAVSHQDAVSAPGLLPH